MSTHSDAGIHEVENVVLGFLERTGLTSSRHGPRRYLWTDAHAVCTLLSLYSRTEDRAFRNLAVALIDQVHHVLGKHRDDDRRVGWLSGLREEDGQEHPTAGGLRIGKGLNERRPSEVFDGRLEWDRDGQYFHYLTKWMHALCRAAAVIEDAQFCRWAVELARVAHRGFVTSSPGGRKRLHWKMSIDLTRPLVPSSGLHDPLDAYITYAEIAQTAAHWGDGAGLSGLDAEIADVSTMIASQRWETTDPLGIGGLLFDAGRSVQQTAAGRPDRPELTGILMQAAADSLTAFAGQSNLQRPAQYRLAFRELGLSIGQRAIDLIRGVLLENPGLATEEAKKTLHDLTRHTPTAVVIEDFWRHPDHQQAGSWSEHEDINSVMLATSLLPDQYLAA